jgi:hypothetical protein
MKENEISIEINRPVGEVFEFTTNPKNTHLWIDGILEVRTNEFPIQLGTEYRDINKEGDWTEYRVVQFKPNKIFEIKQKNGLYHVLYRYEPISSSKTKLTYSEWVDDGDLEKPFSLLVLKKLKRAIEHIKEK